MDYNTLSQFFDIEILYANKSLQDLLLRRKIGHLLKDFTNNKNILMSKKGKKDEGESNLFDGIGWEILAEGVNYILIRNHLK